MRFSNNNTFLRIILLFYVATTWFLVSSQRLRTDRMLDENIAADATGFEYEVLGQDDNDPSDDNPDENDPEATNQPTRRTKRPTRLPSRRPTTMEPTASPTLQTPTASPTTNSPTRPTKKPVKVPTKRPTTAEPTTAEPTTNTPTMLPTTMSPTTLNPTTAEPTLSPTTSEPTLSPTTSTPTSSPTTSKPTSSPTTQAPVPTFRPTRSPTYQTRRPTIRGKTWNPTKATKSPTNKFEPPPPTMSSSPTTPSPSESSAPTTRRPTIKGKTWQPTRPTIAPTQGEPTMEPTTGTPSTSPTLSPTLSPTRSPTELPCKTGFYYHGSEKSCNTLKIDMKKDQNVCATTTIIGSSSRCWNRNLATSYKQATQLCSQDRMRLCSEEELESGVASGLGKDCNFAKDDAFWTSTPCGTLQGFRKIQTLETPSITIPAALSCQREDKSVFGVVDKPIRVVCCADREVFKSPHQRECRACPLGYTTLEATYEEPILGLESCVAETFSGLSTPSPTVQVNETLKPNILLIISDDLAVNDKVFKTPNILKLKEQGFSFENTMSQIAMCGPSRASFLTGIRPDSIGVTGVADGLRSRISNLVTLPQYFKSNGYRSVLSYGKVFDRRTTGEDQDFPTSWTAYPDISFKEDGNFIKLTNESMACNSIPGLPVIPGENPFYQCVNTTDFDIFPDGKLAHTIETLFEDDISTTRLKAPWFVAVGFSKPHLPFTAPVKFFDQYEKNYFDEFINDDVSDGRGAEGGYKGAIHFNNEISGYGGFPREISRNRLTPNNETRHQVYLGYSAAVSFVDECIGRVVQALSLRPRDEASNTLIVFLSDHGFHLGDKSIFGKWTVYEASTRVPFIIIPPAGQEFKKYHKTRGMFTKTPVELVDLFPTLVDIAGLELRRNIQDQLAGVSLVPILLDPDHPGLHAVAISQYQQFNKENLAPKTMSYALRSNRYRFIVHCFGNIVDCKPLANELYDYTLPRENVNLFKNKTNYSNIIEQFTEVWKNRSARWLEIRGSPALM